ncbi:MAG: VTT domain-containing protein [Gammaproteobacteria bacterium]|jgi:phospholipase D1/2
MRSILKEGSNCWQIAAAERAAFIIDGEDYFRAVREAMCKAQHSIFIIGWDIHSELRLVRNGQSDDYPEKLGPLLDSLTKERPNLNIYILNWDFAIIYTMEREFFPSYRLQWKSHKRVHFCLDGNHPVGASQHQKIVVVDDKIAFSGGLDLSKWRWDTSAHAIDDKRRVDPDGKPYPPFHDVQFLVDGKAATRIAELARTRWRTAAKSDAVELRADTSHDPWPASIPVALSNTRVGIARTFPSYQGTDEVREVERLYLDSIESAKKYVYIENQYLSSHRIGQALSERLRQKGGPEIIIVLPEKTGGWLEQHTMDVLRARLLRELRDADQHERLRVYYARLSQEPHVSLMIHAKVMIIDDCFARVASSNLSNRSMGLDSECDLVVESNDEQRCCEAIISFRRKLLAEHLGVAVDDITAAEEKHDSLGKAIESLRGGERTLEPLAGEIPADRDEWVPESSLLDPEKPIEPEEFLDHIVTPEQRKPAYRYFLRVTLLLLFVLGMAAAWRWTPLSAWLEIERIESAAQWIQTSRFTPLLVLAAYIIGGLAVIPVTLMIIATVSVFGPWLGAVYALLGSELAALATFAVGHVLGRNGVSRITGSRINRLSQLLSERGMLTTVTLRIVPVAPFTVINIIAGVSDIRLRDFAIGTFIGMIPGIFAIALLTDRLLASLREPDMTSILILIAVIVLVVLGIIGLRYLIQRRRKQSST